MDIIPNEPLKEERPGIAFFEEGETIVPQSHGGIEYVTITKKAGGFGRIILELSRLTEAGDPEGYKQYLESGMREYTFGPDGTLQETTLGDLMKKGAFDMLIILPDFSSEIAGSLQISLWHRDKPSQVVRAKLGVTTLEDASVILEKYNMDPQTVVASTNLFDPNPGKTQYGAGIGLPLDASILSKLRFGVTNVKAGGDMHEH